MCSLTIECVLLLHRGNLAEEAVQRIAAAKNKTPAQILLRWVLQHCGAAVLVCSPPPFFFFFLILVRRLHKSSSAGSCSTYTHTHTHTHTRMHCGAWVFEFFAMVLNCDGFQLFDEMSERQKRPNYQGKRGLLSRHKRPVMKAKEAYCRAKETCQMRQKRHIIKARETCHRGKRDLW